MEACSETLPGVPADLQARWDADPAGAVRVILDNEVRQGEEYRDCASRHKSLIEWVLQGR